ncbi:hypothetical protein PHYBOEH_010147 [Phytophthora boehmeriae]|uniref:Mitochondrial distribution and morphology protein 35 n=1 Tax=Phytophthora boehmeriae TaxID=109152 RepID=A0A8T1VS09_9STRA|nr:hypothetical protein PHYBOEH_010147 [Phytophthora boehmeriae]
MADKAQEPGCWQLKAAYEQCFDQWYKDVFLKQKANGKVGCQKEYEAYTTCYLGELDQDKTLMEGLKSVMSPEVKERYEAQAQQRQAKAAK